MEECQLMLGMYVHTCAGTVRVYIRMYCMYVCMYVCTYMCKALVTADSAFPYTGCAKQPLLYVFADNGFCGAAS